MKLFPCTLVFFSLVFGVSSVWAQAKLSLFSTPAAQVSIDGKPIGVTPIQEAKISLGTHQVEYKHKELGLIQFSISVKTPKHIECRYDFQKGKNRCVSGLLYEEAARGTIEFLSEPPSDVYMGDRLMGQTPIEGFKLPPGEHRVEFRHPDFSPILRNIEVKAGEKIKVEAKFMEDKKPEDKEPEDK